MESGDQHRMACEISAHKIVPEATCHTDSYILIEPVASEAFRIEAMTKSQLPATGMSDADLLRSMANRADDAENAKWAWGQLFERHAPQLYAFCWHKFSNILRNPEDVVGLVHDVFIHVFEHADQFKPAAGASPAELTRRIRSWLAKQASWKVIDENRARSNSPTIVEPEVLVAQESAIGSAGAENPATSPACLLLRACIGELSARDADVLLTSLKYYDRGSEEFRVPAAVQQGLCRDWKINSPATMRQIRMRALEKVRKSFKRLANVA